MTENNRQRRTNTKCQGATATIDFRRYADKITGCDSDTDADSLKMLVWKSVKMKICYDQWQLANIHVSLEYTTKLTTEQNRLLRLLEVVIFYRTSTTVMTVLYNYWNSQYYLNTIEIVMNYLTDYLK